MAQRGGARPGAGRKPGVVSQVTRDIQSMAREHAEAALKTLVEIATEGDSEGGRVAAANAILDRAYGKPKQALDLNGEGLAGLSVTYVAPSGPGPKPSAEDYDTGR